jgi:predicted small metal-binding protein
MAHKVVRRLLCRGCGGLRVVASCEHAGNNLPGEWKEDEMRELHCACGNRLVAENDEVLVQQVLDHAHEVHPEMNLDEGQAREMVASQAKDTEDASH